MPGANNKRDAPAREGRARNQAGSSAGPYYDGPGSNAGESRGRSSSRPPSRGRGTSQTGQAVDPARDPKPQVLSRNVDFGGGAYSMFHQVSHWQVFV